MIHEHHRDVEVRLADRAQEREAVHGGSTAGPIARKVMDYYLLGKVPPAEPAAEPAKETPKKPAKPGVPSASGGAPATTEVEEPHD